MWILLYDRFHRAGSDNWIWRGWEIDTCLIKIAGLLWITWRYPFSKDEEDLCYSITAAGSTCKDCSRCWDCFGGLKIIARRLISPSPILPIKNTGGTYGWREKFSTINGLSAPGKINWEPYWKLKLKILINISCLRLPKFYFFLDKWLRNWFERVIIILW